MNTVLSPDGTQQAHTSLLSECTGTVDLNSFDSDVAGSLGGQRKGNTTRTLSVTPS